MALGIVLLEGPWGVGFLRARCLCTCGTLNARLESNTEEDVAHRCDIDAHNMCAAPLSGEYQTN